MALLFLLIPIAFPAMWVFVCLLLTRMSGWMRLSALYQIASEDLPPLRHFVTGRFNSVNYNACLRVASTTEHLYVSVLLPFRPGHPGLRIPWSEINIQNPTKGILGRTASLTVEGIAIELPNRFLPANLQAVE
jgi:hypothetical protein